MKKIIAIVIIAIILMTSNVYGKVWFYKCKTDNCQAYFKTKMKNCKYCRIKGTIIKIRR